MPTSVSPSLLGRLRRYVNQGGRVQRRLELGLVVVVSGTLLMLGNGFWRPQPRATGSVVASPTAPALAPASCDEPHEMAKFGQWIDTYENRTAVRRAPSGAETLENYPACARKAAETPGYPTFLHTAASAGRLRTLRWLLGVTAFHPSDLNRATIEADAYPEAVALLRSKGAEPPGLLDAAKGHAANAMQAALGTQQSDAADLSIALTVFLQGARGCTGCDASAYDQAEVRTVGLLFAKGAKIDGEGLAALCARGKTMTDAHLETALAHREPGAIEAAIGNMEGLVPEQVVRRVAAEGIDWGYRDGEDDAAMPLVHAVNGRNEDLVRLLVELGAPVGRVYKDGSSALQAAVTCSDGDTICGRITEHLLAHGADPNRRFPDGTTPLFAAAEAGNGRVIRALLDHGAHLETRVLRETPLNAAERQGNTLAARILAARGAHVPAQPFAP